LQRPKSWHILREFHCSPYEENKGIEYFIFLSFYAERRPERKICVAEQEMQKKFKRPKIGMQKMLKLRLAEAINNIFFILQD